MEVGLIEKRSSFYTYRDERIGQGRENAGQYLRDHPETAAEIEARIREQTVVPTLEGRAALEVSEEFAEVAA